jgi:hypothetical protein
LNLNRNQKHDSYRSPNGTEWLRVNSEDWRTITPKSGLTLVGKGADPAMSAGIRKSNDPEKKFSITRALVTYPTDMVAKFIGWFISWN